MNDSNQISYDALTDEQLAEMCRNREHGAFQELMKRYLKPIYNFVKQYARTTEDTDDITQDTFFKVWKYIGKFKEGLTFRPWLYTIARNTALDHIKRKRADAFSELDDESSDLSFADSLSDTEPLQHEIFEKAESADQLSKVLENLHPDYRNVIILRYNNDMTYDEIALILGRPMNTVKSWHRRALLDLRNLLRPNI